MTNIIKFQSPFERLKDNNQNPEIALIKSIILQAIIDATNISSLKEARKNEIDAKAWIYGGSEDFELMCEYIIPILIIKYTNNRCKLGKEMI